MTYRIPAGVRRLANLEFNDMARINGVIDQLQALVREKHYRVHEYDHNRLPEDFNIRQQHERFDLPKSRTG